MTTALHYHWIPTSTTTSHSSNFYQQHHPAYLLKESPLHSDLPTTQPQLQDDLWTHTLTHTHKTVVSLRPTTDGALMGAAHTGTPPGTRGYSLLNNWLWPLYCLA